MTTPSVHFRTRPVGLGYLRAFESVARLLNFRAAAEELSLTQSAVSRQIQSLEDEVGVALFLRHTRAVELTGAGAQLLQAYAPAAERLDSAVRSIRRSAGRKTVAISTWASFASLWLINRLEAFQTEHPGIDIRIDATDAMVDLEVSDVDIALRYAVPSQELEANAVRLFGEQLAVVASPWLLKAHPAIKSGKDLAQLTFIEAGDSHRSRHLESLSWQRWLNEHGLAGLESKRWLYFNYANQIAQAALAGQGVALARLPLVADHLANGDLVEVLPDKRLDSPMVYWLLTSPRSTHRPEIVAFRQWLVQQAGLTRLAVGEEVAG